MRTRVGKWGNSLAIRLPAALAEEAQLSEGSDVELAFENGAVRARPVESVPTLDELLDSFDPETIHEVVDWGKQVGKEVW